MSTACYTIVGGDYDRGGSASSSLKELFKRVGADPRERIVRCELTRRQEVGVGPHPVLGVVGEVGTGGEGVAVVGAGRITADRHGDAVVVDGPTGRELREDPPVRKLVVEHDRVAGEHVALEVRHHDHGPKARSSGVVTSSMMPSFGPDPVM